MKYLQLLSLLTLSTSALAADWKPFAETINCGHNVQILSKPGEKFVKLVSEGKEELLYTTDGSAFEQNNPHKVLFKSKEEEKKLGDASYTLVQPAMMESLQPKIEISLSGTRRLCDMRKK